MIVEIFGMQIKMVWNTSLNNIKMEEEYSDENVVLLDSFLCVVNWQGLVWNTDRPGD